MCKAECNAMAHSLNKPDYVGPLFDLIRLPRAPSTAAATPVDEPALDRILDAVGKKFIPVNLNRRALWTAIIKAEKSKEIIDRLRLGSRARAIVKSMKHTSNAAESLEGAIKENDDVNQLIANLLPSILADIGRLIVVTKETAQSWSESGKAICAQYDRPPSAGEWLAGVELPLIFEECFGRKAGRARTNNKPSGPTVRFITAVMSEMDTPLADETIVRAMTRFSELRKRRRVVRQCDNNIGQK
jgi:hypothetical protein